MKRPIIPVAERKHDELTGRPILPKSELVNGAYFVGRCRHAEICRWNAEQNCFFYWRVFADAVYIDTILYPRDESAQNWDVFDVVAPLPECKFEIPFDHLATFNGRLEDLDEYHAEMWRKVR